MLLTLGSLDAATLWSEKISLLLGEGEGQVLDLFPAINDRRYRASNIYPSDTETYMFSHIMIGARDLETMVAFYDAVLASLDLRRVVELNAIDEAGIIWRYRDRRWPQFALRRPINGLPATWGNGVQISFAALSTEGVDHAWAIAIRSGALDEGAPGLRPRYAEDFYAAYCRDPEGNKLCFVHAQGLPWIPTHPRDDMSKK